MTPSVLSILPAPNSFCAQSHHSAALSLCLIFILLSYPPHKRVILFLFEVWIFMDLQELTMSKNCML